MSTSGIRIKRAQRLPVKTSIVYFAVSLLCILIANVYAIFGHGVRSSSMDFMFLYPILGGTLVFLLLALVLAKLPPKLRRLSRIAYNLYNSGIAAFTSAAMLTGIMEIAGTGSEWIIYMKGFGFVVMATSIVYQIHYTNGRVRE